MEQETEVTKTVERTPGPWTHYDGRIIAPNGDTIGVCYDTDPTLFAVVIANAQFIVTACNAYGKMREALAWALDELDRLKEYSARPEAGEWGEECAICRNEWFDAETVERLTTARSALSTLPSNDARSDDIGRLRECERVLRIIMEDPRGRGIDPKHRHQARTALNGVPQPETDGGTT